MNLILSSIPERQTFSPTLSSYAVGLAEWPRAHRTDYYISGLSEGIRFQNFAPLELLRMEMTKTRQFVQIRDRIRIEKNAEIMREPLV
jgi:hypothetical protein